MDNKYVAIVCIVNLGFTDLVMSAAKAAGARGGTILNARGTGNKDIEKYFGVTVTPCAAPAARTIPSIIRLMPAVFLCPIMYEFLSVETCRITATSIAKRVPFRGPRLLCSHLVDCFYPFPA